MLETLVVKDFALSRDNRLEFQKGMISITGETGAGKSLTVDALSLLMGARADANMINSTRERAEVSAQFSIDNNEKVRDYLIAHELLSDDNTVTIRRVIFRDNRSKAYINDTPCTLTALKELAPHLVAIHGQHASYKLIDEREQLMLLDAFANCKDEKNAVSLAYDKYTAGRNLLQSLSNEQQEGAAHYKTLRYEANALNELDLKEGDYEKLSADYDALLHQTQAQNAVALAQGVLENDEHNIIDILGARLSDLKRISIDAKDSIEPILQNFESALLQLDEAREALDALSLKANPLLVEEISQKLSAIHDMSRRLKVNPQELYVLKNRLNADLEHFLSLKVQIEKQTEEVKKLREEFEHKAAALSAKRFMAAAKMSAEVTSKIKELAMPDGVFEVRIVKDETVKPRREGRDNVTFMFNANLGEELKPLGAVASGGELSRLALAIEVLTCGHEATPTLVFDEVDSGISGRTASAVGEMLRTLGESVQVLTVTHLPQVAACAHEHFLVLKEDDGLNVHSKVNKLDRDGRVKELCRMLGGKVITDDTYAFASDLLRASAKL